MKCIIVIAIAGSPYGTKHSMETLGKILVAFDGIDIPKGWYVDVDPVEVL